MTLPPGSVWTPDTFIRNERRSEVVVAPARAEYTRVWGDGTVLHSVMYTPLITTHSLPHIISASSPSCTVPWTSASTHLTRRLVNCI